MPPPSEELTLASSILTSPPPLLIMLMPMMARTIPLVSYLLCQNIAPTVEAHWNQRGRGLTSIQARFDAGRLNMVSSGSPNQRWKGHRDRGARVNAGLIKQAGGYLRERAWYAQNLQKPNRRLRSRRRSNRLCRTCGLASSLRRHAFFLLYRESDRLTGIMLPLAPALVA